MKPNYKATRRYTILPEQAFETSMILDTGAGSSCVSSRALPDGWETSVTRKPGTTLRAANGKAIPTRGHIPLYIRLGDYLVRDEFLGCDSLPVTVILGAKFLDNHLKHISNEKQYIMLRNGSTEPVVRDVATANDLFTPCGSILPKSSNPLKDTRLNAVKVASRINLPAG